MENKPISNIALRITLFANRKNNYYLHPSLSDFDGLIIISKKWAEFEMDKDRKMFIMDYSSTLEDCKPVLGITVLSGEEIMELNEYQKKFGVYRLIEHTKNHLYERKYIEIPLTDKESINIDINLSEKDRRV